MAVSKEQAQKVAELCVNEYFAKPPFSSYVNGVGISKVGMEKPDAPDKDDFCVHIMLKKNLPRNLVIPKKKDGVKIHTEVVGEIRAL
ncbi:MAG: hypothetical protein A3I44_01100 [Candidatus Sungbacteria bacterium RIFCSPLOWO2_02_FULL_51_17]|uniref:Uncharacterized protein n=1 Tax=Candidatus Sungbacteria bacterium RIFCSPHIGHO2_02_FULL_51_29 TaxID=1802273 RepID=A0A1G2KWW0_9BACT|nr:MAG: hypothetical protein A2676_03085 [Candidatus Sungbacteria bacterium RIFCSPHIGHO2_01_FULL_51_22]OHA03926.1 MAG: hypothetical protein A3C16_03885 [Candidatus Sungbacteria bacterium RIFCSPHIGHO2_02_FULL_51_29]OHA12332.1 MAG: hypothetical protein A3I44_01100 [Candidatus Sungbacteria bacterium RIFCSPLOWO2_02_FULL_51_17]